MTYLNSLIIFPQSLLILCYHLELNQIEFFNTNFKQNENINPIQTNVFLVAEQLYIWSCLSVRLSVRLSQICVPNFVPNLCPRFLTEALQLLLDSGLFYEPIP